MKPEIWIIYHFISQWNREKYFFSLPLGIGDIVLQQTHHIVTHTGPHKVTSSNIYQIKAKSLPNKKMHDATSVCRGVNFYKSLKKGTLTNNKLY